MSRYAVINNQTNIVQNVIELADGSEWTPPEGHRLVASDIAGIGDTRQGDRFIRPDPPTPEPTMRDEYKAATTTAAKLRIIAQSLDLEDR